MAPFVAERSFYEAEGQDRSPEDRVRLMQYVKNQTMVIYEGSFSSY
jgi:hypothetical protein